MKPLLWRIAGVSLYVLPVGIVACLVASDFVSFWKALFWMILALVGIVVIFIAIFGLMAIGDWCFDKAKRPPR